jgi:glycosyltransferase involved in cell wall biosynthesis
VSPKTRAPGDDRVRVLHLAKGMNNGGIEQLLVLAGRYRDREQFDYRVAYLLPDHTALLDALAEEGVDATCLDGARWFDPRWALRLRSLLRRSPVEVVHAHSPLTATAARLVRLTMPEAERPKLVVTLHNMWASHHRVIRMLDRATYRLDDARLTVSEAVRRSLPRRARHRARALIHGIDVDRLRASADRQGVRRELGIGDDQILIGTVANLRSNKGYPDLISAARQVVDHHDHVRFVSVGQGPLHAMLEAQRTAAGLGDRFRFLGYRPDAARLISGFDIFCLSSHHEGLPVAIMESLVLGIPVVATDVGGVRELVDQGRQGLLVPAHRPDRLAAALVEVVDHPARRHRFAEHAAQRGNLLDAHSAEQAIEQLYLQVLGSSPDHHASPTSAGSPKAFWA